MLDKIVVAVDGSEHSKQALEFACELADKFDSDVVITHVPQGVAADQVMVMGGAAIMIHATEEELREAGETLIKSADEYASERLDKEITTELRAGDPATEIVACAEEQKADCIVIGSRGLGAVTSTLLGSVSKKVNNSADCTCILVR